MTTNTQEWEKVGEEIMKELDFIGDHWVKGDDRPPFSYGGWRGECAVKISEIFRSLLDQHTEAVVKTLREMMAEKHDNLTNDIPTDHDDPRWVLVEISADTALAVNYILDTAISKIQALNSIKG